MSMFSRLNGLRSTIRSGASARLLAVLLGGTLNQKVIAFLGVIIILGSFYYLLVHVWAPLLLGTIGGVFIYLAIKDYERSSRM